MKVTREQLKQIIKEELKNALDEQRADFGTLSALGKDLRAIGRDLVPGGLKSDDQDLMDDAAEEAREISAGNRAKASFRAGPDRYTPVDIFKGSDFLQQAKPGTFDSPKSVTSIERALEALSGMPVRRIYHLILAMNPDSDQAGRIAKHLGPSKHAQNIIDAVDGLVSRYLGQITVDDLHPNIQTNYAAAKSMIAKE